MSQQSSAEKRGRGPGLQGPGLQVAPNGLVIAMGLGSGPLGLGVSQGGPQMIPQGGPQAGPMGGPQGGDLFGSLQTSRGSGRGPVINSAVGAVRGPNTGWGAGAIEKERLNQASRSSDYHTSVPYVQAQKYPVPYVPGGNKGVDNAQGATINAPYPQVPGQGQGQGVKGFGDRNGYQNNMNNNNNYHNKNNNNDHTGFNRNDRLDQRYNRDDGQGSVD